MRTFYPTLMIAACFVLLKTFTMEAQTGDNMTLIGQWAEGQAYAIASYGDYTFCGNGGYVDVFYTGPQPQQLLAGRVQLPSFAWAMEVAEPYLFVGGLSAGLQVVDISDPSNAVIAGSLALPRSIYSIAINDGYAYIGAERQLYVVDISDPVHPQLKGSISDHDLVPLAMACYDHYCVIASREYGTIIVDVADPSAPGRGASFADNSYASAVAVRGTRAYVCESGRMIRILDLTDPLHPVATEEYTQVKSAGDFAFSGDLLYAPCLYKGLYIFDVSNPDSLSILSSIKSDQSYKNIALNGDEAHLACGLTGYCRMNVSDPAQPLVMETRTGTGHSMEVDVQGKYAYVVCEETGCAVVDISDPAHPQRIADLQTHGTAKAVDVSGHYAYVADAAGLFVFDISTPSQPVSAGANGDLLAQALAVSGNYAFLACGSSGLKVADLTNFSPAALFTVDTIGVIEAVAAEGGYVYALEREKGFRIFEASNPINVHQIGARIDLIDPAEEIAAQDSLLVVAASGGVQIWNVADPAHPSLRGTIDGFSSVYDLTLSLPYLYIADIYNMVAVYDLSVTDNPRLAGTFATGAFPVGIAAKEDTLFIADWYDGLYVVHFNRGGVGVRDDAAPSSVALSAYPNPVMSTATILFFLESSREVTVGVYNSLGVPVATLISERQCVGQHNVIWTPDRSLTQPGIYYIRLSSEGVVYTQRCVYLK